MYATHHHLGSQEEGWRKRQKGHYRWENGSTFETIALVFRRRLFMASIFFRNDNFVNVKTECKFHQRDHCLRTNCSIIHGVVMNFSGHFLALIAHASLCKMCNICTENLSAILSFSTLHDTLRISHEYDTVEMDAFVLWCFVRNCRVHS